MNRLRFTLLVSVILVVTACQEASSPLSPTVDETPNFLTQAAAGDAIPGQYIVVFDDRVANALAFASELLARHRGEMVFSYQHALKGFAARLPAGAAEALSRNPLVALVEQDRVYKLDATQNMDANGNPWGLDRIDQRNLPLSKTYTYTTTASNVYAYIIDTGLQANHPDFGTRAQNIYDAFGGNGSDCHGHGTHVAGTVGGSTWGVAKSVKLRGLRVLNCSGSGSTSGIIAALDWLRANHSKPAVANMSLGGSFSSSLNSAVNNLANAGVFVAVAAGNSNANACNASPASASNAYTVASSTKTDAKSSFSNHGSCVEIYAPGSSIKSAWLNSGTNTISGTSMASPHVAGVAALYKATFGDASWSTVGSWLTNNATTGKITGNRSGTPNRLLYKSNL